MPQAKRKPIYPPLPDEYDEDPYFTKAVENTDDDHNWMLNVAELLGMGLVLASVNPQGPKDEPTFYDPQQTTDIPDQVFQDIYNLDFKEIEQNEKIPLPPAEVEIPQVEIETNIYTYILDDEQLKQYQQMAEDLKQQGRVEDPKTVANKEYEWAQRINDQTGQYGNNETYRAGLLETYKKSDIAVLIPWLPAGPNTCEDCLDRAAEGPYPPHLYPPPQHYGEQCEPGDPVPDVLDMGVPPDEDYKEIGTELEDHVNDGNWKDDLINLDENQLESLRDYADDAYGPINEYLRTGELSNNYLISEEEVQNAINNIDNLIDQSITDENLSLYRGVEEDAIPRDIEIGSIIPDKGFASTTTEFDTAQLFADDAILEIQYPEGQKGIPVSQTLELNDIQAPHHEDEILLPRDTKMIVINKYNRDGYNIIQVRPI